MTRVLILLLLLLLPACSACGVDMTIPPAPYRKGAEVDPVLYADYLAFLKDAESRDINLAETLANLRAVRYKSTPDDSVGVCWFGWGRSWIDIDPTALRLDTQLQKTLLYHELGHCLLLLYHQEGEIDIMNSTLPILPIDGNVTWDRLVSRLFERTEVGKQ